MPKTKATKQAVSQVHKPILNGSWHGKDARRMGYKLMLSVVGITLAYFVLTVMLNMEQLWLRVGICLILVFVAASYEYAQGLRQGEADAAFAEIMFDRKQEGKPISKEDEERCFHPLKGFVAVFVAMIPFVLFTLVFAVIAKPALYTLGMLPNWVENLTRQNEFGDALQYYRQAASFGVMDLYRIVVRAMVMPFINMAVLLGDSAVLLVERLSPVLVCLAPLGFGFGYRNGAKLRDRIHTGISIGDARKKQKARKERQKRNNPSSPPERLI